MLSTLPNVIGWACPDGAAILHNSKISYSYRPRRMQCKWRPLQLCSKTTQHLANPLRRPRTKCRKPFNSPLFAVFSCWRNSSKHPLFCRDVSHLTPTLHGAPRRGTFPAFPCRSSWGVSWLSAELGFENRSNVSSTPELLSTVQDKLPERISA